MSYPRTTKGHRWKTEFGSPDIFAYAAGNHNGPECSRCGFSFCHHCTDIKDIPKCTKANKMKPQQNKPKQQNKSKQSSNNEAKHTEGPWTVRVYDIKGLPHWNGEGSAIMHNSEKIAEALIRPTFGERQANARLIAAAPDLLDICKRIKECDCSRLCDMCRESLDEAIAKAEGDPNK